MSTPNTNQAEFNNLYSQYQSAVRQVQLYEQQEIQIAGLIEDLMVNSKTIEGLESNSENSEIIIPLGGLVMVKAQLSGLKEVLVNVGAGVVLPSTLDNAREILQGRVQEMNDLLNKLSSDKKQLEGIVNNLQMQLNQFQQ